MALISGWEVTPLAYAAGGSVFVPVIHVTSSLYGIDAIRRLGDFRCGTQEDAVRIAAQAIVQITDVSIEGVISFA